MTRRQPIGGHTYRRRCATDGPVVEVFRAPIAEHLPKIKKLAAEGLNDREIAEQVGLTREQVYGLRQRNGIPAALPRGRPPGSRTPHAHAHGTPIGPLDRSDASRAWPPVGKLRRHR